MLAKPRSTSSERRVGGAAGSSAGHRRVSSSMAMRPSSRAKYLAPGIVTSEVFERTFGLLADRYQEQ
jgi:hypothetical protein